MSRLPSPLLFIWAGLLIGVSFVATPAKFLAPSLPLAQALDIGRWTFRVLALVEWGLLVMIGLLLLGARRHVTSGWALVPGLLLAVAAVLAVEAFLLRPLLDARVLEIMAGRTVPASALHTLYVVLEAVKLVLVLTAAIAAARWSPAAASQRAIAMEAQPPGAAHAA